MNRAEALDHLLAVERLALTTDFDGTVSEIAPSPDLAVMFPRCRELLASFAKKLPLVAIVSGRPAAEVHQLVGLPGMIYLGNHGLERWEDGRIHFEPSASSHPDAIRSILEAARQALELPGLIFEEKQTGASIHYRLASDPAAARQEVTFVLQELTDGTEVKVMEGRRVVELRPALNADKGTALFDLLRRHDVNGAVYAGDDTTDLDAFDGLRRWARQEGGRSITVAVASSEMPPELAENADLTVEGVEGWADFLDALLNDLDARNLG